MIGDYGTMPGELFTYSQINVAPAAVREAEQRLSVGSPVNLDGVGSDGQVLVRDTRERAW